MKPIEELMLNIKKDLKENLLLDANLSELPQNGGIYLEVGNVTEKNYIRNAQCKRTVPVCTGELVAPVDCQEKKWNG